jgi:uncharacterized protein involved in exopolysaccharide biosynthesis
MPENKTLPQDFESIEAETVHLIDYVNVLLKKRWLIAIGVFVSVLAVGMGSEIAKPTFSAGAKFLPSKNPDMVSRMGTLVGGGEIKTYEDNVTSEYYVELMKSSAFIERIAAKKYPSTEFGGEVDLAIYLKVEGGSDREIQLKTIRKIGKKLGLSIDRQTKVVSLSYPSHEPELSAAVVNACLDEITVYNQDVRGTTAKLSREFVEQQLDKALKDLGTAEKAYADFVMRNRKIPPGDIIEVERDRLKRAVTVQEEVYVTLKKQFELAKIEEQEKKPAIEIIERASPPLTKSGPKTVKNVILAGFVSAVLFVGLAFVLEFASKMDPEEERNKEFRKYVGDIKRDFRKVGRFVGFSKKKGSPPG